ncbi:hypothetical protein SAMN02745704_01751 [Paucidesulfovibrio gracilis DSM 16080]|uniref:Lipoprotein n=1 Tax=Paucidesulfovibrio gracilis DSM 16080 TaxID=1121449 RepID=A0A1T4X407_9BACT|nr:hypothetical protein [Paucidesulfovibrio gracilis]SKA84342.1 hypothetical protein SAMN02745704_01751 [Paucidesulfovibrio gracilis DSM 16080]
MLHGCKRALRRKFPFLLILGLLAAQGCSIMPSWVGGDPGPTELTVDGEQTFEETAYVGVPLTLDMRDPKLSGYVFAGVAFDPALLRLDSVLEEDFRARYVFMPLRAGRGVVEVRIRDREGGPLETYKLVQVTVEE